MNIPFPRSRFFPLFLLAAVFLAIYILPLGVRPLAGPDELRYAEVPREMIASGDWVVPRLNGVRYFEKPVLGYWLNAVSIRLIGESNLAVRLPSVLSVGLSALLLFILVFQTAGGTNGAVRAGTLAVLVYLTCVTVWGIGTFAVLDSLFTFFLTASIIAFFFASESTPKSLPEKGLLILAGMACGLAFMIKGFLAFVVPFLVLVPYLGWQKRWGDVCRMAWLPVLAVVLTALPWSVAIHVREPDFWPFFIWNEHIHRFLFEEAQRTSFWHLVLVLPGLIMPWTLPALATMPGLRHAAIDPGSRGRLIRLSLCWLVLPFLFVSASRDKLVTYILPCFPPIAVLLALGAERLAVTGRATWFRYGIAVTAGVAALALPVLLFLHFFGYKGFYLFDQAWKTVIAATGLLFFLFFCWLAYRCCDDDNRWLVYGLAPVFLLFSAHFLTPDVALQVKMPGILLERHVQDIAPEDLLVADTGTFHAVCWFFRRADVHMLGGPGELRYGMSYPDAQGRMLRIGDLRQLIEQNPGRVVLVTQQKKLSGLVEYLPDPVFQDDSGPRGYVIFRW